MIEGPSISMIVFNLKSIVLILKRIRIENLVAKRGYNMLSQEGRAKAWSNPSFPRQ